MNESRALRVLAEGDPVMAALIDRYEDPDGVRARRGRRPGDAYGALVRAIVGQQLSARAARSIYERLIGLFGDRTPTPRELLDTDPDVLRGAGLSGAKVAFLRDLAEHIEDGDLDLERLPELPDDEVFEQLVQVKGLGPWTVDIFLLFHLGRPDVLPVGDLGILNAAQRAYGLRAKPTAEQLIELGESWRPYRSVAFWYLWASLENAPL